MLGLSAFAELPFSTGGVPVTYVSVTGNALTLSTGSVTVLGDVNITAVKNALAISIGSATITADANVTPVANALTLATGTLQAITWSEIDPGVTMTWTPIDPS
jgi:hypothetical protein|tara:strand:- start:473 stop:781 length:309 start_codon:yes stop_codon:yes gene_type:complete